MSQDIRVATVSQLNGYIKKILDGNEILNNLWIKGEISNFKLHYSGHMYLTLKDEGGLLKAVMFKSANSRLAFKPEDGMRVLARGRISVYEASGAYQLYIEEMTPDGVGALYAAYERLKNKLSQEGLFDAELKKPIPKYPERIGVVTATTGAAVRDIINVITRRFPYSEIIIYPSLVQGAGAAENIAEGIEYFNSSNLADTLIVGRGGGSIEDLWAFNEERVARAIFNSHIPIISAVGHETDFTIADFVADLRAPTPSAAAEISVPSQVELKASLDMINNKIVKDITEKIAYNKKILDRLKLKNPREKIEDCALSLDNTVKRMEAAFKLSLAQKHEKLAAEGARLNAMSPLAVMQRGYAIPLDKDNKVLTSAESMKSGDEFTLRMTDGRVECTVK